MAFSRGKRIALMVIDDENKDVVDNNIITCQLDDNIPVVDTSNNQINSPFIITQDENYVYTPSISTSEKQCEVARSISDDFLLDIDNIPIVLADDVLCEKVIVSDEVLVETNLDNFVVMDKSLRLEANHKNLVDNDNLNPHNRLVDYSSSSESECLEMENPPKRPKRMILKKFDSDYSFHEEKDSDFFYSNSDSEEDQTSVNNTVGTSGLKTPKQVPRKKNKKTESTLGGSRSVQENPCTNKRCQNDCARKFTEQQRYEIFEYYWGLGNHQRQRDWLLSCMKEREVKRRRVNIQNSRRNRTFKYFVTWNGEENEVCQQFILKTLNISQMTLRYTKNHAPDEQFSKPDQRGKHEPLHKTSVENKNRVHEFIKKLPAVPSHYCRASTKKKYLPSELRNISFLYRIFVKDELEFHKIKTEVSLKVFRQIFQKDFNIGFHLPKKDKCTICESRKDEGLKFTEAEEITYANHLRDKEECKQLFLSDQNIAKEDKSFVCTSFDLQKVLSTPHGDHMMLYYSRKYAFYNETVYESGTKNVYCYLWGETDGNRGANEVSTVIYKYLHEVDDRKYVKTVALYCDSCTGQNKNRAMLTMLHTFLTKSKHITRIKITFLLPGHTYMPVDSVHATIERFISRRVVWAPSEWATIIRNARVNPKPFEVINMKHTDFLAWRAIEQNFFTNSIIKTKEGNRFQISQLRTAFLKKGDDEIKIKYSYSDSAEELVLPMSCGSNKGKRPSKAKTPRNLDIAYPRPLEVSTLKFKDLMELCNKRVIPQQFVDEYKKFEGKEDVLDALVETDEEDQRDEEH